MSTSVPQPSPERGEGPPHSSGGGGSLPRPVVADARCLRKNMTPPEVLLWQRLRGKPNGIKFRRQHPIGPYVVDFFASTARLVIEIDGAIHDSETAQNYDRKRQDYIEAQEYRVMRVSGAEVMRDADAVANAILALVESPLHHASHGPPPRTGED